MTQSPMPHMDTPMSQTGGLPEDRIFLTNYVKDLEIGCYPQEHGVLQRVRFDITLEVVRNSPQMQDREDSVISYDDLFNAIDSIANGPRINLLEIFAERLAVLCLADPRARRVHIRIEKLDRLGGAGLGVQIVRARAPQATDKVRALSPDT